MVNVNRGGVTSASKGGAKAMTRDARVAERAASRPRRKGDAGVVYQGNTDHLFLEPPGPIKDSNGDVVGRDPGLFAEFLGGRTKTYYPDRYAEDKEYVERFDKHIAKGSRTVDKYEIKRVEPDKPALPVGISRWDVLDAKAIKAGLSVMLGDSYEENVKVVEGCILYEQEAGKGRKTVISMLEDLIEAPASEVDALDADLEVG